MLWAWWWCTAFSSDDRHICLVLSESKQVAHDDERQYMFLPLVVLLAILVYSEWSVSALLSASTTAMAAAAYTKSCWWAVFLLLVASYTPRWCESSITWAHNLTERWVVYPVEKDDRLAAAQNEGWHTQGRRTRLAHNVHTGCCWILISNDCVVQE